MKHLPFSLLFLAFLISGCQKESYSSGDYDGNTENIIKVGDPLGEIGLCAEDAAVLDSLPKAPDYTLYNLMLPNGWRASEFLSLSDSIMAAPSSRGGNPLGPQDQKNMLIAKMAQKAVELCREDYDFTSDAGPNKPAQHSIAYGLGLKDYQNRQAPTQGACRDELIHGLDCSGFIYQLFQHAGLNKMPVGRAEEQRQESTLRKAFSESLGGNDKFEVKSLGEIPTGDFASGDIIYWLDEEKQKDGTIKTYAGHIGIVMTADDGNLVVYASNGSSGKNRKGEVVPSECEKNKLPERGPSKISLDPSASNTKYPYWFNGGRGHYGIMRVVVNISGKWEFHLKCIDQVNDALVHSLDFSNGSKFSIERKFPDYDGDQLTTKFDFEYNQEKNLLKCRFVTTQDNDASFRREDTFEVKLDRDDTDYFAATLVDIVGSGCQAAVRLVNLE